MPTKKYRAAAFVGDHSWIWAGKERASKEKAQEDLEKIKKVTTNNNAKFIIMQSDFPGYNSLPDYEE